MFIMMLYAAPEVLSLILAIILHCTWYMYKFCTKQLFKQKVFWHVSYERSLTHHKIVSL